LKRRQFIKSSFASGVALLILPHLAFQTNSNQISYEELIGKGSPDLYGDNFQLRKEAYNAFIKMKTEALKSDIRIQIVSSYRGYNHQNRIWERKYNKYINNGLSPDETIKKIIEYSTIPGTSRHHWATDIDIIDANVSQPSSVLQPRHFEENGCYRKLKLWMDNHANSFGFHLVYTNTTDRKGFKYEPWHYSYAPISKKLLQQFLTRNKENKIQPTIEQLGIRIDTVFFQKYIRTHIKGINTQLLTP